jgi:glycosyltransferase involved in cell wall biosynthesis
MMSKTAGGSPLVSIICFCKDRAATIRRCVDSVLAQGYEHFELVVQDGASTDGTLEILRGYDDPRIKIISEPDSGPAEAFWKVLNRCEGAIIGTCLSDEALIPGSVAMAIEEFGQDPELGALTCDGFVTDPEGRITGEFNAGEFDIVDYLFGAYCPFWPGSFFSRQALIDIGLRTHQWTIECLEFETWCRLGTLHRVRHRPVRVSHYAVHPTQLSNTAQYFHEHFDNRAGVIRTMFSSTGFFGEDRIALTACLYHQLYLLYNHVRAYKMVDQQQLLAERMRALIADIPPTEREAYRRRFDFLDRPLSMTREGHRDRPHFSPRLYADIAESYARHGNLSETERLRRKAAFKEDARQSITN